MVTPHTKDTKSDNLISDVTDTSFWVAYYRAKESERPDALFKDPFAKKLVGERGKQISDSMAEISRYTDWSVVFRTIIIDRFITDAIQNGVDAVINLGAGLDARPYRMKLPATLEWIEADYPKIISHKSEILKDDIPKCRLSRISIDLSRDDDRRSFLQTIVPNSKKVLILTEGVIPYLSPEQVSNLAKDLSSQSRFAFWITEYFHPTVYRYLKKTVRQLKMRNAPFLFYPENWYGFFRNLGWIANETQYTGKVALEFKRHPPMPRWAFFITRFLPNAMKEETLRMAGYVLFKKA